MRRLRCNAAVLKSSLCASVFAVMGSISFIKKVPEPPGLYEAPNLIKPCDRKITARKHDDARQRLQRGGHRCRWPDGECRQAWQGSLETQFLHGLVDHFLRQRDVAILDHDVLALLGHHQLDELGIERAQRLVRRLVHVDVEEACQGEFTRQGVFFAGLEGFATLGQRHGANAGSLVADARVADGVQGAGDRLHHRGRTRLLVHVGLEVTLAQSFFLEVAVGAGYRVATEQLDRLGCPLAGQAQVAPGLDVLLATAEADRKSTRLNSSHVKISYAVFCWKKKKSTSL